MLRVICYLPTLAQLRDAFVKRFGPEGWPKDFAVRKTLKVLGLELSKAERGRPLGARSLLKAFGVPQVRKKIRKPKIRNRKR